MPLSRPTLAWAAAWAGCLQLVHAAPGITFPINAQVPPVARLGQPFSFIFASNTFTPSAALTYTLDSAPSWLSIDSSQRWLHGTPELDSASDETVVGVPFGLIATDDVSSAIINVTLVVSREPAPAVQIPLSEQLAKAKAPYSAPSALLVYPDSEFQFSFDKGTFNETVPFYYGVSGNNSPMPSWISFNESTLTFSGLTPAIGSLDASPQTFDLQLIASDVEGFAGAAVAFSVVVGNHEVTVDNPSVVINASAGHAFSYSGFLSGGVKIDGNVAGPANLSAAILSDAPVPDWVVFDNSTWEIHGTPPSSSATQSAAFVVCFSDSASDSVNVSVQINLDDGQDSGSVFSGSLPALQVQHGSQFSLDLRSYLVQTTGVALSVQTQPDESWVHVDNRSLTVSGSVPINETATSVSVSVTATLTNSTGSDSSAASTTVSETHTFLLQILSMDTPASASSTATGTAAAAATATPTGASDAAASKTSTRTVLLAVLIPIMLLLAAVAVLFACCYRRRRQQSRQTQLSDDLAQRNISGPQPAGAGTGADVASSSSTHTLAANGYITAPTSREGLHDGHLADEKLDIRAKENMAMTATTTVRTLETLPSQDFILNMATGLNEDPFVAGPVRRPPSQLQLQMEGKFISHDQASNRALLKSPGQVMQAYHQPASSSAPRHDTESRITEASSSKVGSIPEFPIPPPLNTLSTTHGGLAIKEAATETETVDTDAASVARKARQESRQWPFEESTLLSTQGDSQGILSMQGAGGDGTGSLHHHRSSSDYRDGLGIYSVDGEASDNDGQGSRPSIQESAICRPLSVVRHQVRTSEPTAATRAAPPAAGSALMVPAVGGGQGGPGGPGNRAVSQRAILDTACEDDDSVQAMPGRRSGGPASQASAGLPVVTISDAEADRGDGAHLQAKSFMVRLAQSLRLPWWSPEEPEELQEEEKQQQKQQQQKQQQQKQQQQEEGHDGHAEQEKPREESEKQEPREAQQLFHQAKQPQQQQQPSPPLSTHYKRGHVQQASSVDTDLGSVLISNITTAQPYKPRPVFISGNGLRNSQLRSQRISEAMSQATSHGPAEVAEMTPPPSAQKTSPRTPIQKTSPRSPAMPPPTAPLPPRPTTGPMGPRSIRMVPTGSSSIIGGGRTGSTTERRRDTARTVSRYSVGVGGGGAAAAAAASASTVADRMSNYTSDYCSEDDGEEGETDPNVNVIRLMPRQQAARAPQRGSGRGSQWCLPDHRHDKRVFSGMSFSEEVAQSLHSRSLRRRRRGHSRRQHPHPSRSSVQSNSSYGSNASGISAALEEVRSLLLSSDGSRGWSTFEAYAAAQTNRQSQHGLCSHDSHNSHNSHDSHNRSHNSHNSHNSHDSHNRSHNSHNSHNHSHNSHNHSHTGPGLTMSATSASWETLGSLSMSETSSSEPNWRSLYSLVLPTRRMAGQETDEASDEGQLMGVASSGGGLGGGLSGGLDVGGGNALAPSCSSFMDTDMYSYTGNSLAGLVDLAPPPAPRAAVGAGAKVHGPRGDSGVLPAAPFMNAGVYEEARQQHSSPARQHSSPAGQHSSPARQHSSPAGQHFSPAGQHSSPAGQHSSPAGQHFSPVGQHSSPADDSDGASEASYYRQPEGGGFGIGVGLALSKNSPLLSSATQPSALSARTSEDDGIRAFL